MNRKEKQGFTNSQRTMKNCKMALDSFRLRLSNSITAKWKRFRSIVFCSVNPRPKNIVNLKEHQIRRAFIEVVNDHISFYNNVPLHREYHEHAINSHITTAYALGWKDLALKIQTQFNQIKYGRRPKIITK